MESAFVLYPNPVGGPCPLPLLRLIAKCVGAMTCSEGNKEQRSRVIATFDEIGEGAPKRRPQGRLQSSLKGHQSLDSLDLAQRVNGLPPQVKGSNE